MLWDFVLGVLASSIRPALSFPLFCSSNRLVWVTAGEISWLFHAVQLLSSPPLQDEALRFVIDFVHSGVHYCSTPLLDMEWNNSFFYKCFLKVAGILSIRLWLKSFIWREMLLLMECTIVHGSLQHCLKTLQQGAKVNYSIILNISLTSRSCSPSWMQIVSWPLLSCLLWTHLKIVMKNGLKVNELLFYALWDGIPNHFHSVKIFRMPFVAPWVFKYSCF